MDAVSFPPPPAPFLDDDCEFGDFTFATASSPSGEPRQPLPTTAVPHSRPQAVSLAAVDDDWGDFISSPLGSHPDPSPPPTPPTATAAAAWERPRGPLPLSLFGADEEKVDDEPDGSPATPRERHQPSPISSLGSPAISGCVARADLKDLIANLYGSPPPCPTAVAALPDAAGAEDGFGDDGWEFKAAVSSLNASREEGDIGISQDGGNLTHGNELVDGLPKSLGNDQNSWSVFSSCSEKLSPVGTLDHIETDKSRNQGIRDLNCSPSNKENLPNLSKESEQVDAVHCTHSPTESAKSSSDFFSNNEMNSSLETDENHSVKSTGDNILTDFYCRLREESLVLISQHLKDLKEAQKICLLSGREDQATKIEEDIQDVYEQLRNDAMVSEGFSMEEHSLMDVCIDELLKSTKDEYFKDFEEEYHLSERITLALESVSSAVGLCRHSMSVLYILQLASKDERDDYVLTWHNILLSCVQELQHGAIVWAESCCANVCDELISQGGQYFVALGEVYRIVQILCFSLRCFKPWVLSDPGKLSEMLNCFDKCTNAWTNGLDIALKRISDSERTDASIAKALVQSIKTINELEVSNLQKFLRKNEIACKVSLAPTNILPGMKVVSWNGDHYFVKIANFWANKISSDPPHLSHMPSNLMKHASRHDF